MTASSARAAGAEQIAGVGQQAVGQGQASAADAPGQAVSQVLEPTVTSRTAEGTCVMGTNLRFT